MTNFNNFNKLQQWLLNTSLGRYILESERIFYTNATHNIFGQYSLQIGTPNINFLQRNKITNHYIMQHNVSCDLLFLPIANNSIDLIICPHILEYISSYQYFLAECHRILSPNGKLIITSFNKLSLFNLFAKNHEILDEAKMLTLDTVKQSLLSLDFTIIAGKFFSYCPPINNVKILSKLNWLEFAGDRWFPTMANVYALVTTKKLITPTLIKNSSSDYTKKLTPNLGNARVCNSKL